MHYYQFNIGDYRKDTSHLTPIEHYIYRFLLDWYYLDEQPIPLETQQVLRRLNLGSEFNQNLINVLTDFFELTDKGYIHNRVEQEIEAYHNRAHTSRKNGKLGGRPRKTQQVNYETQQDDFGKATNNHKPITKNQRTKKTLCTLEEYINQCKQEGRAVIPEDDKVFEFATNANIPLEYLRIAWVAFRDEHLEKGDKKQADWVQTFRNYVRNDYVKVWAFNKDGECYLTTKGKQIASDMEKKENERAK